MIRVLIAEDEPPVLRRTKRLIERIDPDFIVAATAGDGEEALEKMRAEHFDALFTDIRMPVMDGMRLMNEVQRLYPDCSIVAVSGYQDFEYVSAAIRVQAVDYLLKPVTEDTLEKLLFKLKERFLSQKRERMQQSVAARINHMFPEAPADGMQAVQLGLCLFCAGAMPNAADGDLHSGAADVWQKVSLAGMARELCSGVQFVQEYMGDTPAECILVCQPAEGAGREWTRELFERVRDESALPVSCACLSDTAPVPEIGKIHKKLRRLLSERIVIGQSLYEAVSAGALSDMKFRESDFTADSEAAMRFTEIIIGGDPARSQAFRRALFERFEKERWTQRRVLSFFLRVITLLESKSQDPRRCMRVPRVVPSGGQPGLVAQGAGGDRQIAGYVSSTADQARGTRSSRRCEEYLRGHYAEHITGQTLAKKFGYVPSYISFLFRQSLRAVALGLSDQAAAGQGQGADARRPRHAGARGGRAGGI